MQTPLVKDQKVRLKRSPNLYTSVVQGTLATSRNDVIEAAACAPHNRHVGGSLKHPATFSS